MAAIALIAALAAVAAVLLPAAQVSAQVHVELPPAQTVTLPNGLTVTSVHVPDLPIVTATMMISVGSTRDPAGKEGLAALTGDLLRSGTSGRTGPEIAEAIDFVGGSLSATVGKLSTQVHVAVLARHFDLGMDLLADVVLRPAFPENEIALRKRQVLAGLRAAADSAPQLMARHLEHVFYGLDHPNGRLPTESSVAGITREDLVAFHERFYGANRATLVVVGDIPHEQVFRAAEAHFGAWAPRELPPLEVGPPAAKGTLRVRFVEKPGQTQVQIGLAMPGLAYVDERFTALQLANYVLGVGDSVSRLFRTVRIEHGMTYHIGSELSGWTFPGALAVKTATRNEEMERVLELIIEELRRFAAGITQEELELAQSNFVGSFPLSVETIGGMAGQIAIGALYGKTPQEVMEFPEQVSRTTLAEVNAVIADVIDLDSLAVVLVGDPAVLEGVERLFDRIPVSEIERVQWTDPIY